MAGEGESGSEVSMVTIAEKGSGKLYFSSFGQGNSVKTRLTKIVWCVIIKDGYVSKALTKRVPVFLSAKRAGDGGSPAGRCTAKITSELQGEGVSL